uniref:Uncharacterized protein n=1 Tax=Parascaris univalens TaxID=6257 RepID=A0A915A0C0_PARUN
MVVKITANRRREHLSICFYMLRFQTCPIYLFISFLGHSFSTTETKNFLPHQLAHVLKSEPITVEDAKTDDLFTYLTPCIVLKKPTAVNILARK